MYPFSQSVTPAVRTHLEAQMAFLNDMSKSLFRVFQQLCDLNIQLTQTMLEETAMTTHQLMTAERQTEVIGAATSRAQPATDKLRAYQKHVTRVAAEAQVDLARVAEQHVQETTRTARALADEVARAAAEETERHMQSQQETMRKFTDPFQSGDGHARGNGKAGQESTGMPGNAAAAAEEQRPPGMQPPARGGSAGASRKET
jgi:phasin family protein